VVASVEASAYADLFARVYGEGVFTNVEAAYDDIADAIAAYEATADVNRFTSKYDFVAQGKATFTEAEARGQEVFTTSGKCVTCHAIDPLADGTPPLFTTFGYANVGAPKNPALPFYDLPADYNPDGKDFVDRGLGAVLGKPEQDGKHKIPTLRNIDRTAPYMHNGVFRTLDEVVRFLSTRDTDPSWGAPEVAENVTSTVGKLGLTEAEISDLVAFLRTLSDGYVPTGK
jgi:cytochrome c peroxidase